MRRPLVPRALLTLIPLLAGAVCAPAQIFTAGSDYVNLVVRAEDPIQESLFAITTTPGPGTMRLDLAGTVGIGGIASGSGTVDVSFRWKDTGGLWHDAAAATYSAAPGASTPFTMSATLPISPNEFGFRAMFDASSSPGAIINVGGGTPPNFSWTPVPEPGPTALAAAIALAGFAAWRRRCPPASSCT